MFELGAFVFKSDIVPKVRLEHPAPYVGDSNSRLEHQRNSVRVYVGLSLVYGRLSEHR